MPRRNVLEPLTAAGLALALLAALGALGAFAFVKSGLYNAGASKPHSDVTEWLTHETMVHSVKRHARGIRPPARRFASADVVAGFCAYETHCVACHGAAAVPRQLWAEGMEPSPPYLLDATDRFSPAELFWIAKNGIKMTGMPSWRAELSDPELWNLVAFLEASRHLPPQTYGRWRSAGMCGPAGEAGPLIRPGNP